MSENRLDPRDATILSVLLKGETASPNRDKLIEKLSDAGRDLLKKAEATEHSKKANESRKSQKDGR